MTRPSLLILAAGIGSRYGGSKQLDPVGPHGARIFDYTIHDALKAGFGKIVFVVNGKEAGAFRETVRSGYARGVEIDFAIQDLKDAPPGFAPPASRTSPWGTGHAVLAARNRIKEPFAVVNADDFYGPSSFTIMCDALQNMGADSREFVMAGFELKRTLSRHGPVSRGECHVAGGRLVSVIERERVRRIGDAVFFETGDGNRTKIPGDAIVSMNFWGFAPAVLFPILEEQFKVFIRENAESPKAEFYIPTAVNRAILEKKASVRVLRSSERWFGMTWPGDR
ncbi:MAG: NTP transferase domain-containing protein, partial [Desulfobacterales bacterium]|nr:NTP transferase domain-containing protein [Desulfobacterales bacterium]